MHHLTVNRIGRARRATLHGKDYIVVPMTMIVPGVLNGSNGPLYYSPEEVSRNAADWNGVPILNGHPESGSGRTPEVIEQLGVGQVFKSSFSKNRLRGEAWFDIARLDKLAPGMLHKIENGGTVELSTGFKSDFNKTAGNYKGISYNASVIGIRPDHLAVFTGGETGACSLKDGCGINNKQSATNKEPEAMAKQTTNKEDKTATRDQLVEQLVKNCGCAKEELDALDDKDDKSFGVISKVLESKQTATTTTTTSNMDGKKGMQVDEPCPKGHVKNKAGDCVPEEEPTKNRTKQQQNEPLTVEQWMDQSNAPEEIRQLITNASLLAQKERDDLVKNISSNKNNPYDEKELKAMPLNDETVNGKFIIGLRSLAELAAPQGPVEVRVSNYLGQATTNRIRPSEKPTPLGLPSFDFADTKAKN